MIAVLLIAVDCAVMRTMMIAAESGNATPYHAMLLYPLALGVTPMASLLVCALILALWGLWRRGESHPFVVGFEVFGMIALFVFVAFVLWSAENLQDYLGLSANFIASYLNEKAAMLVWLFLVPILLLLPLLFLAVVGGWLFSKLGVKVAIEGWCDGQRSGVAVPEAHESVSVRVHGVS